MITEDNIHTKFTCAHCGGSFIGIVPEEDACAEAVSNFGFMPSPETCATICDECYKKFMSWYDNLSPETVKEMRSEAEQ